MQDQTQKEPAQNRHSAFRAFLQPYLRAPVVGAAFGALMVLSPIIMGGHLFLMLFSLGGLVIVVGGVITVAFMSFDAIEVHKALDAIRHLFKETKVSSDNDLHSDVTALIYCARLLM